MQDCIGVTYTATQSILGLFKLEVNYSSNCFSKSVRLHRSYLYSNSVNTGTISAKVQDCTGVGVWDYLSYQLFSNFQQKCKIAQQLSQHWNFARLHRSHVYSKSVNTKTI